MKRTATLALLVVSAATILADDTPMKSQVFSWGKTDPSESSYKSPLPIRAARTLDFAKLDVDAIVIAPGSKIEGSIDSSDYEKLFIAKEGELSLTAGSATETVGPWSIAIIQPGDAYAIENLTASPASYYLMRYISVKGCDSKRLEIAGSSFIRDWDKVEYAQHDRGGYRQNFDRPTCMIDRFEFHTTTLNEGLTNHATHTHRVEEMVLILKGEVEMQLGDKYVKARHGDLIFVEAEIPHSLRNTGKGATEYFAFQWHIDDDENE